MHQSKKKMSFQSENKHRPLEESINDIFSNDIIEEGIHIQDDVFFDPAGELEGHEDRGSFHSCTNKSEYEMNLNEDGTYSGAALLVGEGNSPQDFSARLRSVRFEDEVYPCGTGLEDSLSPSSTSDANPLHGLSVLTPAKGWLDDMEENDEVQEDDEEDPQKYNTRSIMAAGAAGVAFYLLRFLARKLYDWFSKQHQTVTTSGGTTADTANEGVDTSVQTKSTMSATTGGHASPGATVSKSSAHATMQASFNASASSSQSSSSLAGGFLVNNTSSTLSSAQ